MRLLGGALTIVCHGVCCCCRHYAMFVGNTGTGKTAIMMNKLRSMDPEAMAYTTINMNSFSDAPSLQVMMEQPLEKKSGVRYGPPGSRRCVCQVMRQLAHMYAAEAMCGKCKQACCCQQHRQQ